MRHEFFSHRIGVHVVQLLLRLGARIHIEVLIAPLPEPAQRRPVSGKAQRELALAAAFLSAYSAREPLLEDLDDSCGSRGAGFADEQVHMLGHENEADQRKAIASTYFLENLDGHIPDASRAQQRPALIATEGDEMQVTPAADTFQMVRHNIRGRGAHPLPKAKPQRVGHPGKFS